MNNNEIQYYIKPTFSSQNREAGILNFRPGAEQNASSARVVAAAAEAVGAEVIAVVENTETTLINATDEQRRQIEAKTGVTLYPNYEYDLAAFLQPRVESFVDSANSSASTFSGVHEYTFVVEGPDGQAISDATVEVWPNGGKSAMVGVTNSAGTVQFQSQAAQATRVEVRPRANFWCARFETASASPHPRKLPLEKISLPFRDSLNHFYPTTDGTLGAGVKVAIVDTGVDAHIDLPTPIIGRTILKGIVSDGCVDNGTDHGTHVAGIIAGQGKGIMGIAPSALLMVYRVFEDGNRQAQSLDISLAIDLAVDDGADIINLSLGFKGKDGSIENSIRNAVNSGVLVIAATGNDGSEKVRFPATMTEVFSVGAVGLSDAFAHTSTHRAIGARQRNSNKEFVADFSNYAENSVDGAGPGVAVISTGHADGYQAMSGTSMATPAITGVAAVLLSRAPELAKLTGSARVNALQDLLYNEGRNLQFDSKYVGSGVPAL